MPLSLQQHVTQRHGESLSGLLHAVASAAQQIQHRISTAPLGNVLGAVGHTNVQGEQQQKLDVLANDLIIAAMRAHPGVAAIVSEEDEEPVEFDGKSQAEFLVIFDPLDGSSNLDVNVNTGTIVSIQRMLPGKDAAASALQSGSEQVAALYINYGPATMLVYTAGKGTHGFTLMDGEFMTNAEAMQIPKQGPYYSVNEGNVAEFPQPYRDFIDGLRDGSILGTRYSARYVGSFIADFHRTLLKGGVFLYPPTAKAPNGKLRLLYEANPLAFIAEQAGGAAIDGSAGEAGKPFTGRILERSPRQLHERTTLIIGSSTEVAAFGSLLAAAQAGV